MDGHKCCLQYTLFKTSQRGFFFSSGIFLVLVLSFEGFILFCFVFHFYVCCQLSLLLVVFVTHRSDFRTASIAESLASRLQLHFANCWEFIKRFFLNLAKTIYLSTKCFSYGCYNFCLLHCMWNTQYLLEKCRRLSCLYLILHVGRRTSEVPSVFITLFSLEYFLLDCTW